MDPLSMSRAQRVHYQRHVVGFVWQQTSRNLLPFLTAAENMALPMVISKRRQRASRVRDLLGLLDVSDCADRRPGQLSGGQQQRVAVATASEQVREAMREAAGDLGTTVLVVTHDPTVSDDVRRTVAIRHGRTSTEVLRQRGVGPDGVVRMVSREYTVIDRAGRIQLPKSHVEGLGLRDRMRIGGAGPAGGYDTGAGGLVPACPAAAL